MVRWTSVEKPFVPARPNSVRAIVVDPELGLIEEQVIEAEMVAAERLLGSQHDRNIRLPSGDFLLSAKPAPGESKYGDVNLFSRCVIVGYDYAADYFADARIGVELLRKRIAFRGPDDRGWHRYADRQTPNASKAE